MCLSISGLKELQVVSAIREDSDLGGGASIIYQ